MPVIIYHRYSGEPPKVEMAKDEITLSDGSTRPNTPETLAAYHEERLRFIEAQKQRQDKLNALHTGKRCPFQYDKNEGWARECMRNCVFASVDGCVFAGRPATVDTKGIGSCPFMAGKKCSDGCALYNGGCTMATMIKGE